MRIAIALINFVLFLGTVSAQPTKPSGCPHSKPLKQKVSENLLWWRKGKHTPEKDPWVDVENSCISHPSTPTDTSQRWWKSNKKKNVDSEVKTYPLGSAFHESHQDSI
jgi:hypothetical protein